MADMYIGILLGFLLGSVIFYLFDKKKIEAKQFEANVTLYKQLLLKKQNRKFEYSKSIRKVINRVHVALLVEHRNEQESKNRV